jgi:hypothetical protein
MEIKYATIAVKQEEENKVLVKHICVWEGSPTQDDVDNLIKELAEDPNFGMVGDTDYVMHHLERTEETEHIFEQLNIPKSFGDENNE